jgi:hypothetical protein
MDADLQMVKTLYTIVYMTCPIHWVVKAFHDDRTEYAAQLYVTCRDDIKFNLSRQCILIWRPSNALSSNLW